MKKFEAFLEWIELRLARRAFETRPGVQDTYQRPPLPEREQKLARMDARFAARGLRRA